MEMISDVSFISKSLSKTFLFYDFNHLKTLEIQRVPKWLEEFLQSHVALPLPRLLLPLPISWLKEDYCVPIITVPDRAFTCILFNIVTLFYFSGHDSKGFYLKKFLVSFCFDRRLSFLPFKVMLILKL